MKEYEVKICINERCPNKEICVHGIKKERIYEQLGKDYANDDIYRNMFPVIYPVWCVCKRYITDKIE